MLTTPAPISSPPPLPETGDWFVLRTRARQEKVVAQDLQAMGIGHYVPLASHTRRYGKRKEVVQLPLFTGYVFLRGSLDDAYRIDRTHRIAQILPVPDQRGLEWELANIHLALCQHVPLDPYPYLQRGIRVVVRSGPMRGLQGVIEDRTRHDRLILQVDMLGQALSVEVDGALLEITE